MRATHSPCQTDFSPLKRTLTDEVIQDCTAVVSSRKRQRHCSDGEVKCLNILKYAYHQDQNKQLFIYIITIIRQVNHKELESLRFTCLTDCNTCDVIPDTK